MRKRQTLEPFLDLPPSTKPKTTKKNTGLIPYFVRVKGCINCYICKINKEKTGKDYGGFNHELMVQCTLLGCQDYNHSYCNPFIHPSEMRRLANLNGKPEIIEKAEKIATQIEKAFKIKGWEL
jgi:hypothetical protein